MAIASELRYPTSRLAKIISGILALLLFALVSVSAISGFLLYQIVHPARNPANIDVDVMMGHPLVVSFPLADGQMRDGLFFPGLRGAPTIIVCHGYGAQRGDVLTLVTALQEHQFNVFLFDFVGHGTVAGVTTLGYKETGELRSALQSLASRDDIDSKHFGLWGTDMGAYAVLEVATSDPRVAAFAVEDPYADPRDMVRLQVKNSGLQAIPYVERFVDFGFRMYNYPFRKQPPVTTRLAATQGIPKLFILAADRPAMENLGLQLFVKSPDPKQMLRVKSTYRDMSDDDRKAYENQLISFFLLNIPPTSRN
ncbi:MAG TPA: alpha/beta fold hydrolase [Candidatus Baltobacteraceae bacterium]|jgi:pimeloyl-ACP methyl ester carboxylesterase|nr:alpha/beta fold hydrolase [Candidatus Baltobacteraceae bacterium]